MKQTFSFVMALVAMMLFSTACDKNSLVEQNPSAEAKMQTVTITAGIASDNAQTKTYIGGDEVNEGGKKFRKVYWSAGDEIGVFVGTSSDFESVITVDGLPQLFKFSLKEGCEGSESGIFEGTIPAGTQIHGAFYPNTSIENLIAVKTEQTAIPGTFDPTAAFMQGIINEGKLNFTHSLAHLQKRGFA